MALVPSEQLTVDEADLGPLVAVVASLDEARSGWVNLRPDVAEGAEPSPRSLLAEIFSARGDPVPMATWTAPDAPGRPITLGIQHGAGPRALARLEAAGLDLPEGWVKVADHSRRGLVVTAPNDADVDDGLWWLLTATHGLSQVELTGTWHADVYR